MFEASEKNREERREKEEKRHNTYRRFQFQRSIPIAWCWHTMPSNNIFRPWSLLMMELLRLMSVRRVRLRCTLAAQFGPIYLDMRREWERNCSRKTERKKNTISNYDYDLISATCAACGVGVSSREGAEFTNEQKINIRKTKIHALKKSSKNKWVILPYAFRFVIRRVG